VVSASLAEAPRPLDGEFQVNSYTTDDQLKSVVAVDPQGNFVVTWDSSGSYDTDTSALSVQAQRFAKLILFDGFESGDLTTWFSTVQ
jgi:hypothetical protein